jgi:glycosyltransferase involved in cell wall biosynthesis
VEVISADLDSSLKADEWVNNVHIRRFSSFAPHGAYYFSPQIAHYLKNQDFEIVHAHNYHAFPAFFAARGARGKFIFTPHYHGKGSTFIRNILNRPYKLIASGIFRRAEKIICVSDYEKTLIEHDFPFITPEELTIIPNGIDLVQIQNAEAFDTDEKIILYIGRLEEYKNIDIGIKALQYLPVYHFYIIGSSGSYKSELVSLVRQLNLEDRVRILENVSDTEKYRWLKSCTVFINLSGVEAFGITVLEALAAGRPVIINEQGGLSEFGQRFSGVYPIAIDRNQSNMDEVLSRTINGIKDISPKVDLEEYNWDRIVERIETIYYKGFL